jgi:hypothetical protein
MRKRFGTTQDWEFALILLLLPVMPLSVWWVRRAEDSYRQAVAHPKPLYLELVKMECRRHRCAEWHVTEFSANSPEMRYFACATLDDDSWWGAHGATPEEAVYNLIVRLRSDKPEPLWVGTQTTVFQGTN